MFTSPPNWKKSLKEIATYFMLVLLFFVLNQGIAGGEDFFENRAYIRLSKSMLADGDYNLINQVPEHYRWLVTKKLHFPSVHSELQTPALIFFRFLEKLLWNNPLVSFKLAASALQALCVVLSLFVIRKTLGLLNKKMTNYEYGFYFLSSSAFYFTAYYNSVIDVFYLPILGSLFYQMTLFYLGREKEVNYFFCGLLAAMLYVSKISFIFLLLGTTALVFYNAVRERRYRSIGHYLLGATLSFTPFALNSWTKMGEIGHLQYYFTSFFDISFENIYNIVVIGFFSPGGLFFINPTYLIFSITLFIFLYKNLERDFNKAI